MAKPDTQFLNPPGIANLGTFSQVAVVSGGRTIHVSGQLAWNAEARLVAPGDLAGQTEQVFTNLGVALAAAGAGFADVVKLNTYVVNLQPDDRKVIAAIRNRHLQGHLPASTLVGVAALVEAQALIEVEAVAVVA
jgi:enamine deaminase RidA (YjgF/YER057c/UK114 family)